jgi:hypothetical protein
MNRNIERASIPLVSFPALAIDKVPAPVWRSLLEAKLVEDKEVGGDLQVLVSKLFT